MNRSLRCGLLMAVLFKLTFAALLIALAFVSTYTSSAAAFSDADLKGILALGGAVTAAFLLLTLCLAFLARSTGGGGRNG